MCEVHLSLWGTCWKEFHEGTVKMLDLLSCRQRPKQANFICDVARRRNTLSFSLVLHCFPDRDVGEMVGFYEVVTSLFRFFHCCPRSFGVTRVLKVQSWCRRIQPRSKEVSPLNCVAGDQIIWRASHCASGGDAMAEHNGQCSLSCIASVPWLGREMNMHIDQPRHQGQPRSINDTISLWDFHSRNWTYANNAVPFDEHRLVCEPIAVRHRENIDADYGDSALLR